MIRVGSEDFDSGALIAVLERAGGGAVASFTGIVRGDDGLLELRLDHYAAMTEKALAMLERQARSRWPLLDVIIVHRVGPMVPGERIVFVGTASAHRAAALEACAFLIDKLKTEAPFWKHQRFADGREGWVEARAADDAAAARWSA
ncbi:molybdenum cofactor biosynthesis protein MoaE [Sphingomonas sp. ID0503]|uniref:molybdenum cofactor biosynthesis protein MoaE n=1 Tax=Sphingomonas sp. ID0503 TaxID=3399691 RepID=UPI003AFB44AE